MNDEQRDNEYVAEYLDGPMEGQTEHRALVDGQHEDSINTFAAIEGVESMFRYVVAGTQEVEGELHARYRFDKADSDPVEADPEDNRANDPYLR